MKQTIKIFPRLDAEKMKHIPFNGTISQTKNRFDHHEYFLDFMSWHHFRSGQNGKQLIANHLSTLQEIAAFYKERKSDYWVSLLKSAKSKACNGHHIAFLEMGEDGIGLRIFDLTESNIIIDEVLKFDTNSMSGSERFLAHLFDEKCIQI